MNFHSYNTFVFDCDGVVLNSNTVKTDAFRAVTLPFGEPASAAFVEFHKQNGGVSRFNKFDHFLETILPAYAAQFSVEEKPRLMSSLLERFSQEVREGLLHCQVTTGLQKLREAIPGVRWLIVSGADQAELREVLDQRGISHYFDFGVYGSPKDKYSIVSSLLETGRILLPALSLGDSRLDYEVSKAFDLDFMFVHEWTELDDWQCYCHQHMIPYIPSISHLLKTQ